MKFVIGLCPHVELRSSLCLDASLAQLVISAEASGNHEAGAFNGYDKHVAYCNISSC